METRFLLANPVRRGGDGPGLHVPAADPQLRPDHGLPVPPTPPPQRRQPGHLHRQHRLPLPEVWKHIAAHRGQFAEGCPGLFPTMTPVSRDPGGMERRGLAKAAWTPGETASAA